ncbi:MAG TPA: DUF885 domain-containing protein [Arenimonas sp.]|nr:DUF885 domain-containing protein [Arenimonas sp.]
MALAGPTLAHEAPAPTDASASAARAATPAWVARSNAYSQKLLDAEAPFAPEFASFFGIAGYDGQVVDLGPDVDERYRKAIAAVRSEFERALAGEKDPDVRQDLQVLIGAIDQRIEGNLLDEKFLLPWIDAPQLVFQGTHSLLRDQVAPERRAKAVERLRRYAGLEPGSEPIADLARAHFESRLGRPGLLPPTRLEVERGLQGLDSYIDGIKALLAQFPQEGADEAVAALEKQLRAYADWTRSEVLPMAREDFRLPPELYAFRLKQVGVDDPPEQVMQRAQLAFMEIRANMQQIAPLVAAKHGFDSNDYRDVIRALKAKRIPDEQVEASYREVIDAIDEIIAENRIVDVPKLPMQMRLGSAAESAAQPAPHYLPPQLIGNTGQQGTFVLPMGNPGGEGDQSERYDDFNFEAVRWTLSAHEGRPGHDLQFVAMVERGIPLARSLYAFNSVNVEGWALYAEAEMVPYEPLEGQLIALQFRLMRAARAMLDPMLNLGLTDRETAGRILTEEVVLSPPMARQELDRYTVNAPGQATAYFHGYTKIMELRMRTELALGEKFDRKAFNNFLLDQGMLPPDLLAKAVETEFIPRYRK